MKTEITEVKFYAHLGANFLYKFPLASETNFDKLKGYRVKTRLWVTFTMEMSDGFKQTKNLKTFGLLVFI